MHSCIFTAWGTEMPKMIVIVLSQTMCLCISLLSPSLFAQFIAECPACWWAMEIKNFIATSQEEVLIIEKNTWRKSSETILLLDIIIGHHLMLY